MNKKQLIKKLKEQGVEPPKNATNSTLEAMLKTAQGNPNATAPEESQTTPENEAHEADQTSDTASVVEGGSEEKESSDQDKVSTPTATTEEQKPEASATMVMVKALSPIYEGASYAVGDEFEVTEERARALGELVEILG